MAKQAEADLDKAEQRYNEFVQSETADAPIQDALGAIHTQIDAHEKLMEQIREQIKALSMRQTVELKAPFDGVVIPIPVQVGEAVSLRSGEKMLRRPGEVVSAGEPILAIAESDPQEIIAYVSESALGHVHENMEVEMVKSRERAQIGRSVVVSIGPTAERMPERLWYSPNVPQWGWPVLLNVPPGLELVAGEVVRISDF
jgi:multidrug resistance efflux pump